jgi:hypothetical protein
VIEITAKIGASGSGVYNENKSSDYNSGVELGARVDYYFNNIWSFCSGFIADRMGSKNQFSGNFYEDKLSYLSIPVNANWHFGSTRKWNLHFGLSPSSLTNAKFKENGNTTYIPESAIESFQLGFTYGIEYKIEINEKFGFLIDAQFFNGLTNINKASQERIVNGGYSFNVGGVIQL